MHPAHYGAVLFPFLFVASLEYVCCFLLYFVMDAVAGDYPQGFLHLLIFVRPSYPLFLLWNGVHFSIFAVANVTKKQRQECRQVIRRKNPAPAGRQSVQRNKAFAFVSVNYPRVPGFLRFFL